MNPDEIPAGSILNGLLTMVKKSTAEYDDWNLNQPAASTSFSGANLNGNVGFVRENKYTAASQSETSTCTSGNGGAILLEGPPVSDAHDPAMKATTAFHVNTNLIQSVPANEQASELHGLGLEVFNQDEFEQGVIAQVDQALEAEENVRMKKMLQKELKSVEDDIRSTNQELQQISKVYSMLRPQSLQSKEATRKMQSVKSQQDNKTKQLRKLKAKQKCLAMKINGNLDGTEDDGLGEAILQAMGLQENKDETEQQRMVRLGLMTPFGTVIKHQMSSATRPAPKKMSLSATPTDFEQFLLSGKPSPEKPTSSKGSISKLKRSHTSASASPPPHKLKMNKNQVSPVPKRKTLRKSVSDSKHGNFDSINQSQVYKTGEENIFDKKDKRVYHGAVEKDFSSYKSSRRQFPKLKHNFSEDRAPSDVEIGDEINEDDGCDGDSDYVPDHLDMIDDGDNYVKGKKKRLNKKSDDPFYNLKAKDDDEWVEEDVKSKNKGKRKSANGNVVRSRDDGHLDHYESRLSEHKSNEMKKLTNRNKDDPDGSDSGSDLEIDGGFKVPGRLWNKLYRYQKTGVRWLWELHCQQAGGIIGDEMGLGKTIQTIAYLTGLKYSRLVDKAENTRYRGLGPVIIVCPTTVMHQWVREFHTWSPELRVAVLHNSGNYKGSAADLIRSVAKRHDVLITSYSGIAIYQDSLLRYKWHYIILDEGHKIRNPDAQATLASKQFKTCHRIILSGSPMQNNLKELWSLFDFVFPGKLGTLPDFMAHFSVPIVQGGYSNATQVQVQTAYKCACVLRDTINPYLLRRMKADVKTHLSLPDKNEQVLFCRLTDHQKEVYREYLDSKECNMILNGKFMVFPGLITLRKICNHPDISTGGPVVFDPEARLQGDESLEYGHWKRSGKLIVIESLLKLWKKQNHRVLLFSQSRQMLTILEAFTQKRGYQYMTMDGGTPISARQPLINKFNTDPSIFLFLLTTRVGGVGVNLTGANRVVIYDPDWNPSTDLQARERAWRIGQSRNVTIYRLLTAGTIEEKIYHRQIFKTFLTNRVLKDPKQRRFFKSNDLFELFNLGDDSAKTSTETSAIFAGTGSDVRVKAKAKSRPKDGRKNRFDELKKREKEIEVSESSLPDREASGDSDVESALSDAKLEKMRELARALSQKIGKGETSTKNSDDAGTKIPEKSSRESGSSTSKKHKKKRKRKDAILDGEEISFLKKHKTYQSPTEENSGDSQKDDEYVLQKLFKQSGVHSALQHDKIVMSSNPDYALVEGEADRVAKQAAHALKQSRARCNAAASGIPTWTGHSGHAAGGPAPRQRFGLKKNPKLAVSPEKTKVAKLVKSESMGRASPKAQPKHFDGTVAGTRKSSGVVSAGADDVMSSKELLTRMQSRNLTLLDQEPDPEIDGAYVGRVSAACANLDPNTLELITDIRNHVAFGCAVDGQATTEEVMKEFSSKLPGADIATFRAMLKQICHFDKRNGIGIWQLKTEFR